MAELQDDQSDKYVQHRSDSEFRAAAEQNLGDQGLGILSARWEPAAPTPAPVEPKVPGAGVDVADPASPLPYTEGEQKPSGVAWDLFKGATEFPLRSLPLGIHAAVNNLARLVDTPAASFVPDEKFAPVTESDPADPFGNIAPQRVATTEEQKAQLDQGFVQGLVPDARKEFNEPETVTGGLAKGLVQFATGSAIVGPTPIGRFLSKFAPAKLASAATAAGDGAVVSFAAFDGHEARISNLLQKTFPEGHPLRRYALDVLAANPGDGEVEGRLKNAMEGLGVGMLFEGTLHGLKVARATWEVSALRKRWAGSAPEPVADPERVKQLLGGDSDGDFVTRVDNAKAQAAREATAKKKLAGEMIDESAAQRGEAAADPGYTRNPGGEPNEDVFINFNRINQTEDVKKMMQVLADDFQQHINEARGGEKRTHAQIKNEALTKDAWDALMQRRLANGGNAFKQGDAETLAARLLWDRAALKTKELADVAVASEHPADLVAFRKMLAVYDTIQKEVIAIRTAQARQLNAWAIETGQYGAKAFRSQLDALLEASGGREVSLHMAQMVNKMSPSELSLFAEQGVVAKTMNGVRQALLASLLTNPATHVANFTSNASVLPLMVAERYGGALASKFFGTANGVELEEAAAYAGGAVQAFSEMTIAAGKTGFGLIPAGKAMGQAVGILKNAATEAGEKLLAGEFRGAAKKMWEGSRGAATVNIEMPQIMSADAEKWTKMQQARGGQKVLAIHEGALSADVWRDASVLGIPVYTSKLVGAAFDGLDVVTRTPARLMEMGDGFFKSGLYRAQLRALATRKAVQALRAIEEANPAQTFEERLARAVERPKKIEAEVQRLISDPTETNLKLDAADHAMYGTFNQRPDQLWGGMFTKGRDLLNLKTKQFPGGLSPLGSWIMPFINTPLNIFSFVMERSPVPFLTERFRADIVAGGARADMALAKMAMGTMTMLSAMDLAFTGKITGSSGPNPKMKDLYGRVGFQPNSAVIGDKMVAYDRMDPVGMTLGIAADLANVIANTDGHRLENVWDAMGFLGLSAAHVVFNKSYMQGLGNTMEAIHDPVKEWPRFMHGLLAAPVPAVLGGIARAEDPYMRSARTATDALMAKIPGLREGLPLRRDLWGDPVPLMDAESAWQNFLVPFRMRTPDPLPVDKELLRLEYSPAMPNHKFRLNSVTVDLSEKDKEYYRYVHLAGNDLKLPQLGNLGAKDFLNQVITGHNRRYSAQYARMSDENKVKFIDDIIGSYREAAQERVLDEFGNLRVQYQADAAKRRRVIQVFQ